MELRQNQTSKVRTRLLFTPDEVREALQEYGERNLYKFDFQELLTVQHVPADPFVENSPLTCALVMTRRGTKPGITNDHVGAQITGESGHEAGDNLLPIQPAPGP